jgi:hypothetical protein
VPFPSYTKCVLYWFVLCCIGFMLNIIQFLKCHVLKVLMKSNYKHSNIQMYDVVFHSYFIWLLFENVSLGMDCQLLEPLEYKIAIVSCMGAGFSKFQGVLRFALQILTADSLKGLKTQPTTLSRHQKHDERTTVCYSPLLLLNSENPLRQNRTDHMQLNRLHYISKKLRQEAL